MFKKLIGALVGLAMMGMAGAVHATLIDNDLTTIDDTTGLEWLDVTLTKGEGSLNILAGFGGFIQAGWEYATAAELCSLFTSQGDVLANCISPNATVDPITASSASLLIGLLGSTPSIGTGTFGLYDDDGNLEDGLGVACLGIWGDCERFGPEALLPSVMTVGDAVEPGRGNSNRGSFLVCRSGVGSCVVPIPEVPEPSTLALFAIGLAGLGFMSRRRQATGRRRALDGQSL